MPKVISLVVGDDHVQRISQVRPLRAVEELIWNALDADAKWVAVEFDRDELGAITRVRVIDHGHGIQYARVDNCFGSLGGSEKSRSQSTPGGRKFHGHEGQGRYRTFSIGADVKWESTAIRQPGNALERFSVTGNRQSPRRFVVSDPVVIPNPPADAQTGVTVTIGSIRNQKGLQGDYAVEELLVRLAPYMLAYRPIELTYDGREINPDLILKASTEYNIPKNAPAHSADGTLRIIEWNRRIKGRLYLCDADGFAYADEDLPAIDTDASFSAYLQSDYILRCHERGELSLGQINPDQLVSALISQSNTLIEEHFRPEPEPSSRPDAFRREGVYPYAAEPSDQVEEIEREVFDAYADVIYKHMPALAQARTEEQALLLKMTRRALSDNPSSVREILSQVFKLSPEEQNKFAEVLKSTSLVGMIRLTNLITDRVRFLNGLKSIVNDAAVRQHVLERSHLHKILQNETWIFGEEYSLGASDVTLKTVLVKFIKALGRDELAAEFTAEQLKRLKKIPDLCLFRTRNISSPPAKLINGHLIVELKKPGFVLNMDVKTQIERYGAKVATDPTFSELGNHFTFIAVGRSLDDEVRTFRSVEDPGRVSQARNCTFKMFSWCEVIEGAEHRLAWLRDKLNFSVKDNAEGLEYLRRAHADLLPLELRDAAASS